MVEPDLLFVSRERLARITEANLQGAPDLAIEVLSPSTRKVDERVKLRLYERMGVREYWLVDPFFDSIAIHRLRSGKLLRCADLTAEAGDVLATPLLPGFELPLPEVFA